MLLSFGPQSRGFARTRLACIQGESFIVGHSEPGHLLSLYRIGVLWFLCLILFCWLSGLQISISRCQLANHVICTRTPRWVDKGTRAHTPTQLSWSSVNLQPSRLFATDTICTALYVTLQMRSFKCLHFDLFRTITCNPFFFVVRLACNEAFIWHL